MKEGGFKGMNRTPEDMSSVELAQEALKWATEAQQAELNASSIRKKIEAGIRAQRHVRLKDMTGDARERAIQMMVNTTIEGDGTPANPGNRVWRMCIEESIVYDRRTQRYAMAAIAQEILENNQAHIPTQREAFDAGRR